MNEIRELIRRKRLELGLSVEVIATELNADPEVIETFENGAASIESSLLFGLINILNLTPEEVEPAMGKAELEIRIAAALDQSNFKKSK